MEGEAEKIVVLKRGVKVRSFWEEGELESVGASVTDGFGKNTLGLMGFKSQL